MATYTNIPTANLEPGKPIRSVDHIALRDNPIAIAEGAAGAPRIQTNAIANSAVTTAKIANSSVTAQKLATGGNENNWTRCRIATSTAGQVGAYDFVTSLSLTRSWNQTIAGSSLRRAAVGPSGLTYDGSALSGTWRIMGYYVSLEGGTPTAATLALRIS